MSVASVDFFDPIKNALARMISSNTANPPQKAAAQAALDTYNKLSVDVPAAVTGVLSGQSPVAASSPLVADLENGLNQVVGDYVGAVVAGVPIVGGALSPEAKALAIAALSFGEQHAHDLLAGFFASHTAAIASTPSVAAVVAAPQPAAVTVAG